MEALRKLLAENESISDEVKRAAQERAREAAEKQRSYQGMDAVDEEGLAFDTLVGGPEDDDDLARKGVDTLRRGSLVYVVCLSPFPVGKQAGFR